MQTKNSGPFESCGFFGFGKVQSTYEDMIKRCPKSEDEHHKGYIKGISYQLAFSTLTYDNANVFQNVESGEFTSRDIDRYVNCVHNVVTQIDDGTCDPALSLNNCRLENTEIYKTAQNTLHNKDDSFDSRMLTHFVLAEGAHKCLVGHGLNMGS